MQSSSSFKKTWQEEYLDFCQKHGLIAKEYKNLLRFQSEVKMGGAN